MLHVSQPAEAEFVDRKSRFIARIEPVVSGADAAASRDRIRAQHSDANHLVYAFLIGDEASENAGLSDDGEPHGTAGRPVMSVLRGSGIRNAQLTVVRYFGGTKLGTGGLVSAYGSAAKLAIAACVAIEYVPVRPGTLSAPYSVHEKLLRLLIDFDADVRGTEYGSQVVIRFTLAEERVDALQEAVADLTRGSIQAEFEASAE